MRLNIEFAQYVVADNSSFVLLKIDRPDFLLLAISNRYGIEKWNGKIGFWIGKDKATVSIISSEAASVEFTAHFIPGPSLPEKPSRDLKITSNNGSGANVYTVANEQKGFPFQVNRGENLISIEAIDQPTLTKLPNGDTRTLLIGVLDPRINFIGTNR